MSGEWLRNITQQSARTGQYSANMTINRPSTRDTIAENLRVLMEMANMTQAQLAKKSGLSQRQISNVLNKQTGCGIEAADAMARVFNLNGWQLLMPHLPKEILTSPTLGRLVESYVRASPDGRDMINRVAEREALYGKKL